ncbi:MAG: hypothetical protein ACRDZO_16030 [Egibacteraceae bacterium]
MALRRKLREGAWNPDLFEKMWVDHGLRGVLAYLKEAVTGYRYRRRALRLIDELNEKYGAPSPELRAEIDADARRIFYGK